MNAFRRCLEACDVKGLMALWRHVAPHLSQPASYSEGEATLHRARTEAQSIPIGLRVYSHRWLTERGYQSGLPDELRPKPDQVHPVVVGGVGISVNSKLPDLKAEIHGAMSNAVMEMYADGDEDPARVKKLMMERRARVLRWA